LVGRWALGVRSWELGIDPPSVLSERIIRIAVKPSFARFGGRDHLMPAAVRVLGGVAVGRAVAAARAAAGLAGAQMHPLSTDLDALFALVGLRRFHAVDRVDMSAGSSFHRRLLRFLPWDLGVGR